MLAIEVVFAGSGGPPTLVFDEVDAGVGGQAAVEIGRRLARLARTHQVLVVTHLPQVAAFADRHLVVAKDTGGAVTTSGVRVVEDTERARELARMLAGLPDSDLGIAHAEELLAVAARERRAASRAVQLAATHAAGAGGCASLGVRPCSACRYQKTAVSHARMAPMRLPTLRRTRTAEPGRVVGAARLDRRTKRLVGRLRPGDIAVIDHVDLDRVAADSLVAVGVAAVLNAKPSVSGRYPNLGPEVLIEAGIPLRGRPRRGASSSGCARATSSASRATRSSSATRPVATGVAPGRRERSAKAMADAREGLSVQLEAFAANTMEYLKQERDLLLDGVGVPDIQTQIAGRHCLIVVRGYDYKADLDVLRPYIREFKPVLIGVDGGADALVEAGYTPDMIIGDMDSVSDDVLRCGAEVIVHAYPDGRAPGLARVQQLGVPAIDLPGRGHQRGPRDAAGRREGRRR